MPLAMVDDKGITKIEKLNIKSIKNITRIIIKTSEIPKENIEKLFTNKKIELVPIADNLFLIEAKKVPIEEFEQIDKEINNLIKKIKIIQLAHYDNKETRNTISFPDEITEQVSKFIVAVNKEGIYDVDKVALVLQNILGDIYEHPEVDKSFLDRKSIEYLAKASVSKIMEDAKLNLTEALREILIN